MAGRVPVKVNLEGGSIQIGDPITISSQSGIGKKAIQSSQIVGFALQSYDGSSSENKVLMFVSNQYWQIGQSSQSASSDSSSSDSSSLLSSVIDLVKGWLESLQVFIENGVVRVGELIAEKITSNKVVLDHLELRDEVTGELRCIQFAAGAWSALGGECPDISHDP